VRLKDQIEKSEERYSQTYDQASQYLTELQTEKDRNQRLQSELDELKDYGFPLENAKESENLTQSGVLRQKLENAPRKGQFDPARDFISVRGRTPTDSDTFEPARTFTSTSSDKTVERKDRKLPFQFRFF
jgi:alanyl-tRNA synthetase